MMKNEIILSLLTLWLPFPGLVAGSDPSHSTYLEYKRLRQDFLAKPAVSEKTHPCLDKGFQTVYPLSFSLFVVDIHNLDEINQVVTFQAFHQIVWEHKELAWNSSDYSGIDSLIVDSSVIWTPLIYVVLGQLDSFAVDFYGDITVESSGKVLYDKFDYLHFTCNINFQNYPFDVQYCKVGFYIRDPPVANVTVQEINFPLYKVYNKSGEWKLTNIKIFMQESDGHTNSVKVPFYLFTIQRQPQYYVITIISPLAMTSLLIPLGFLIPVPTGEKISYMVAIFTSTAVFLNFISDKMPRNLASMPYLAILFLEVLAEGLLAIMATIFISNWGTGELVPESSSHVRVFPAKSSETRKLSVSNSGPEAKMAPNEKLRADENSVVSHRRFGIHLTARTLDKIFFLFFSIGQIILLLVLFAFTEWVSFS